MLNILIPMAGLGSRFARAGYRRPKPLIEIHGVPMIRLVIDNIRPRTPHRFIFAAQRAHHHDHGLFDSLARWAPGCAIVPLDGLTEGAACTALCAGPLIDGADPLMIANSDQFVETDIDAHLSHLGDLDGLIMTMPADDPKWSYVAVNPQGLAARVAEKQVISAHATVGIYSFARGSDFVAGARAMIADDARVNGEFYIAPVYNTMIAAGAQIGVHSLGHGRMHGLGIPADLDAFLMQDLSRQVAGRVH